MVWNWADMNCEPPSILTSSGMSYAWNSDLNAEISFFAELWCSWNWQIWIHQLIQSAIDKYKWQFCWKKSAQICWTGHPGGNDKVSGFFYVSGGYFITALANVSGILYWYIYARPVYRYTDTSNHACNSLMGWVEDVKDLCLEGRDEIRSFNEYQETESAPPCLFPGQHFP